MEIDDILAFARQTPDQDAGSVLTPFEEWCDRTAVHPEKLGAWDAYQRSVESAV